MNEQTEERLLDLLCKQVTEGLTGDEQIELSDLERHVESGVYTRSLEITAAAIAMSAVPSTEQLPDNLKAAILARADDHFAELNAAGAPAVRSVFVEEKPPASNWGWLGWAATAAMGLALIGIIIYNQQQIATMQAQIDQLQRSTAVPPSMAQKRDQLMRDAEDLTRAAWTKGNIKGMDSVSGEVVWSDEKQMGYMTFRGLPPNDPNREAYQLWIFEQADLEAFPKDGGVFNVSENGEAIVPIEAKLKNFKPKAFAVTIEKPGGVVVSERARVAALAPVKPSST